jgi:hypothetical protein
MHKVKFMKVIQSFNDFRDNSHRLTLSELNLGDYIVEKLLSLAVLHDDVQVLLLVSVCL